MRLIALLILTSLVGTGLPASAEAQGIINRIKKRAQESVNRRTEEKAAKAVEGALDEVECAATNSACIDSVRATGKEPVLTDAEGKRLPPAAGGAAAPAGDAAALKPGEGAWANYDFIPGETVLFADDLTKDNVGDFPRRMEFVDGSIEIVTWNGGPWMRVNETARWMLPLAAPLPVRYTLEFTFAGTAGECWIYPNREGRSEPYWRIGADGGGGATLPGGRAATASGSQARLGKPHRARIMVDGRYAKIYVDERRLANVPNFDHERADGISFWCDGREETPFFFTDFRVGAGGRKLYDGIAATGRVATQGIYFDTGADRIRPESSPTLKEIAAMLTEHPELKLLVEGHTDDVGAAAANLALSERRAAAVKAALVAGYGVDAGRLATKGLGATKPAVPNTTPEGRQTNRRVELVRQ